MADSAQTWNATTQTASNSGKGPNWADRETSHYVLAVLHSAAPVLETMRFLLKRDHVGIGRQAGQPHDIALPDRHLSRLHAMFRFQRSEKSYRIQDNGSKNGILVNGRKVKNALLAQGDVIRMGKTLFLFTREEGDLLDLDRGAFQSIGDSPLFQRSLLEAQRAAASELGVLLTGETGVGKEVMAEEIHRLSGRKGELVALNCGAIPATLMESTLFGHVKGAFSGADRAREGLFQAAHGGTLFLDEVAELSPELQVKLLRVLEEGKVLPLGATAFTAVDARIIAATNQDLQAAMDRGRLRKDLFARLNGWAIHLPPLRERKRDILPLARHFLAESAAGPLPEMDEELAEALLLHDWPFNIRELKKEMHKLAIIARGMSALSREMLSPEIRIRNEAGPTGNTPGEAAELSRIPPGEWPSEEQVRQVLVRFRGRVSNIVRALKISRTRFYRWMARYGLDPAAF